MNNTKVFEAAQSPDEQTTNYEAFGLKTDEHWEIQAAALKAKLDASGIESARADNAEIVAAAPEFFAGRGENESASIIATMRALRFHDRTFTVDDPAVTGHAAVIASANQADVPELMRRIAESLPPNTAFDEYHKT